MVALVPVFAAKYILLMVLPYIDVAPVAALLIPVNEAPVPAVVNTLSIVLL
ncbi:MAG: hypothetical protein IPI36_10170 [Chitinophagaceae bacterium]|nr:hypothetical protein [Chitinophagaceae bacterium]